MANIQETPLDLLAEIRDAILELAGEVSKLRLQLADVIDPGSGEQFPGYIRTKEADRG